MSEVFDRYQRGGIVNSSEWNRDWRHFGTVVWEDWMKDQATLQLGLFEGGAEWKKVHPIEDAKTPEQEHLARPTELKNGITHALVMSFDRDLEAGRLAEVRAELSQLSHDA